jgi:hypothetical protein
MMVARDWIGKAAKRGTYLHGYLEHAVGNGVEAGAGYLDSHPADDYEWIAACQTLDVEALRARLFELLGGVPERHVSEMAYRYECNTRTVVEVGEHRNRDYGTRSPFDVGGTLDAGMVHGRRGVVADYKTGAHAVAATTAQMRFLCACLAATNDLDEVTSVIVQLAHHAREGEPQPEQQFTIDKHTYTRAELDDYLVEVRSAIIGRYTVAALREAGATGLADELLSPGDHCKWCKVRKTCDRGDAAPKRRGRKKAESLPAAA